MSIYSNIAYDHDKITKLIFDIEALGRGKSRLRKPLFKKLEQEVLILQQAEEKTLYHELEDEKLTEALVEVLEEEDRSIESQFKELLKLKINSNEWHEGFEKLKYSLLNHFAKEEKNLFPKAHKVLDLSEERELAEDLKEEKNKEWKVGVEIAPASPSDAFAKTVRAA